MKPSYTAVGLIGLALGGLWYAGGGATPPTAAAGDQLRVADAVSHENLAVFLVHGPDAVDDSRVVTLQEALDRKWAVVHETGQVNQLAVENLSPDHDLFVQSGDIIKGGRQDRLFASDLLVPPGSGRVPVRVHCVEHGRWAGRANEAAAYFASSDSFAVGNNIKLANASYDQGGVWEKVKENQDKLSKTVGVQVNAAASPTSLQLALENPAVRAKAEAYRAALAAAGGRRGVVGAVFVVNGKVTSAEVYGSNGLFRKAWPKLLKAASEEALAEKADGAAAAPPTARDVEAFLATAGKEESGGAAAGEMAFSGRSRAARSELSRISESLSNTVVLGDLANEDPGLQSNLESAVPELERISPAPNPPPQPNPEDRNRPRQLVERLRERGSRNSILTPATTNPVGQQVDSVQLSPRGNSIIQPVNPAGNRLNTNRVENRAAVVVESKDAGNRVVHRSYIKK